MAPGQIVDSLSQLPQFFGNQRPQTTGFRALGGASAAYSTDAVAGVVSFIMDTKFEGFTGHVQGGTTSRQDGENVELSGTWGMDMSDRGHINLSGDYFQ